ncbi:MAG: DNA replication/repair protein RecF [Actinomycetota bacterium]
MPGAWVATRLDVSDVRSWSRASVDLPEGGIVLSGPNGAGKTSLVEALVLACLGVSCRTAREVEAIRTGAPALHVGLDLRGPGGSARREIGYAPRQGRRLSRDGEPVRSLSDWRADGSVLVFMPEELRAVKGPPAARRRHLDRLLEAAVPGYADDLAAYGAALSQRNAALRNVRAGRTGVDAITPWDDPVAQHGARLVVARRAAMAQLADPFARWLDDLGGGAGGEIALEPSPAALVDVADDDVESALRERMDAARDREVAAAMTLAGPHRDDVFVGQRRGDVVVDLRRVGSQGEQRTAVLAMLMAHRAHLAERAGLPILVLDDVLSELDPTRRGLLLDAVVGEGQCILTTADPASAQAAADRGARVLSVREGLLAA